MVVPLRECLNGVIAMSEQYWPCHEQDGAKIDDMVCERAKSDDVGAL